MTQRTSASNVSSSLSPTSQPLVGWVVESPGRGTLSLIVTCLFTIFLCTWVVIHPRVHRHRLPSLLHKIILFLKALVAPEFIAVEGLQEWSQARKMVETCDAKTGGGLKLVHAFYISMMALRYRISDQNNPDCDGGERVLWPNQYSWLLSQGLIQWKDHASCGLSEENIRDKSNADGVVKLAALCQVLWFVVSSILRTVHSLPLSQLETMTLSYIPVFVVTYFFWWVKPKDIKTPSVIELPHMSPEQMTKFEAMAVSNDFDYVGADDNRDSFSVLWKLTPRVFEKEAADRKAKVLQHLGSYRLGRSYPLKDGKSKEIVVSYWDPSLYRSKMWPITCLFGASFGALHLISWDAVFPTFVELWLWRASAITSIVSMLVFMNFEKVVLRWGGPMTMISLISPVLYLLSRIVMMGGVIAAFRASDPEIYQTYVVSTYWVHVL